MGSRYGYLARKRHLYPRHPGHRHRRLHQHRECHRRDPLTKGGTASLTVNAVPSRQPRCALVDARRFPGDVTAGSGGTSKVDLTLFPQRSIAGADASLEGIRVVLEPSGESVTSDAEGRFTFARAPYDPQSTILLDPATVPHGYESPAALPIAGGTTDVTLAPQRKVERATFR